MEIVIEQISPATTWYLRHQVLWPNEPFNYVQLEEDNLGYHWGLYVNHQLVSVISLFLEKNVARFRKFATSTSQQGKGFGSILLKQVLIEAQQLGATTIWCDARATAKSFYHKFGMEESGEVFLKDNIEYIKMNLTLNN